MHIGLIGGIGPAATQFYYQRLLDGIGARGGEPDITIVHAQSPTLRDNLSRNDSAAQVAIYQHLTKRLEAAGAECVVVTSIAGHFCIDAFKQVSPLPVIDMLDELDGAIAASGYTKLGIMGTATVMRSRLYGRVTSAQILPPPGDLLDEVHNAYVHLAGTARVFEDDVQVFQRAIRAFTEELATDAIILGGTDLTIVYSAESKEARFIDCAAIHADAVIARVMES